MSDFLFREICNHVYLGQWELARACAFALLKHKDICEKDKQSLLTTLLSVAKNPNIVRSAWPSVSCPSLLGFLSCQLLLDIGCATQVKSLKRKSDFNVLVETFLSNSHLALEELSSIHSRLLEIQSGSPTLKNADYRLKISPKTISAIKSAFVENAGAVSKLLEMLFIPSISKCETNINSVTLEIHSQNLLSTLKSIKSKSVRSDNLQHLRDLRSKVYFLLSILPESITNSEKKKYAEEIFLFILQLFKSKNLDVTKVHQALFCRSSPVLLKNFSTFQKEEALKCSDIETKVFYPKCFAPDGTFSHQDALLSCLESSSHFVKDIMEFCIDSILDGKFISCENVMHDSLFVRLKPLILLSSWSLCKDDSSAMNVIEMIKTWSEDIPASALSESCNKFKLNIALMELCMDFYRSINPNANPDEINSKKRNILFLLQTQSPLRVLHTIFGLKNMPPRRVIDMLYLVQGQSSYPLDVNVHLTDQAIYSGYLSLVLVMEAIRLSCEFKDVCSTKKIEVTDAFLQMFTTNEMDELEDIETPENKDAWSELIDSLGPQRVYLKVVSGRIKKAEEEVKTILPLAFRVEILENIFSLLFTMSSVLPESNELAAESDQGCEGDANASLAKKKSFSSLADYTPSSDNEKPFQNNFIFSTVKLKDCDDGESRYLNQFSSKSTESNSSCGMQPYSFLCNELITKEILSLLSRIVIKAKLDVYQTLGLTERGLKNKSTEAVEMDDSFKSDSKLSICNAELVERTSRLLQHINEATWRYEVVTSGIFQRSNFVSPLESRKYLYLVQSQCSASSSDTDKEGKKRRKKKKLKRKLSSHKKELIAESSIIQCMLSSPEALLRYSLWNKNLTQAGDVIQLFKLNSSSEAKEVILIQELKRISQKLSDSEKSKMKSSTSSHTPDGKTLLSIIEDAATTGVQSSEICLGIHEELSSLKVPDLVDISGGIRHPELVQGSDNIYSVFLTDLGCTSGASLDLTATLLGMASKSWNDSTTTVQDLDAKIFSKKKLPSIRGIQKTMTIINSILREFITVVKEDNMDEGFRELFWPKCQGKGSFTKILCSYIGSLDGQRFTEELKNWQQTASLLKEFTILMTEDEANEQNGTSVKDTARENKIHMTYKSLSKVVRGLRDWSSEMVRPVQKNYDNYLSKLFNHLHQVTSAVQDCQKHGVVSATARTRTHTSDFSILKESPVDLLKNIILQSGVPPDKMEKFAIRMKVDLVHVLAQACLPYVPLLNKSVPCTKLMESYQINFNGHSMLILNNQKEEWMSPRHPDLVARELMKEMIQMINDTALAHNTIGVNSLEALVTLSEHSHLSSWMKDCSEIAFVDLDLLTSRQEKLAFFINVTNVAWLHAILLEVRAWKSLDQENEAISNFSESNNFILSGKAHVQLLSPELLERLVMQKVVGYSIGQLGPVSLFDLRYQLLHSQLPVPKHLEKPPFDKLLDDPRPEWEKYTPPLEPKLLFVLVEGLQYSPKLQTVNSEIIDDELEEAMRDYFDFGIKIDLQKNKVSLPSLLEWYSDDFSKDDEQDLERAPYEGLVNLISTLVRSGLAEQFKDLFNRDSVHNFSENIDTSGKKLLPFVLEFTPPLAMCGIILQYSDPSALHHLSYPSKVSPIIETDSTILTYLKDKCLILNDLYEIFRSDNRTDNFSKENLCLDDPSMNLFSFQGNNSNVPLTRLLAFYKNMLQHRDNEDAWFSSALSPSPDRIFISHQLEACFAKSEWHKALVYVDAYLEHFDNDQTYVLLRKLILEHLVSLNLPLPMDSFCYALGIKNPVSRAKTILLNLFNWSDSCAIEALKYCLFDNELKKYPDVYNAACHKLKKVILYKKIFDASEIFGDSEVRDCVFVFNNWQEIADCSIWDQSRILDFLKSSEKYDLAVMWCNLHQINKEQKLLGLSMNIIWHLTQDPLQEKEVHDILDSFDDLSECVKLCDMVLPDLPNVKTKLCLVQHLVSKTTSHDKHYYYYNMSLGLKMLCALGSSIKESYVDIVSQPYLILEQMLMNVELRDAEKALNAIYEDINLQTDIAPVLRPSSVNQLVEDYASKALELHFLDSLLDDSSSSTIVVSTEEILACEEPFIMPPRVPTKEEWVPDTKINCCQVCREERFNMFSRRHHCRRCGRVVCANCSQHALIVEGYGSVKVRVCDDCYNSMTGSVSLSTASFEKRYRLLSSMRSSSPRNSPFQGENIFRRRTSSIHSTQQAFRWVLSCDSEQNANVRNEFSYEKTPSITLCYSILKLHNDDKKCALFLMNMCDRLLGKIKMKRSGKGTEDIDYSMVISMMKSLILNAKVKSHQVEDSEGERLADLYFRHFDVIELLVSSNCLHLIPKGLTNPDTVRKLRDTLWQEERMNLALEISTKFSLEKNGIWSSWGGFCLMGGDWPSARTKFQQCMKVVTDKSDAPQENPLLSKILKILEEFKYPSSEKAAAISRSLSSLRLIQQGLTQFESEVSPLNELVKRECLYYLNLYGTHNDTVEFFQRHGLINDALNYIKTKNCDPNIFIEALFMPCLKNALLAPLKRCIYSSDPNLLVWSTYLFATCRHLDRLKYFNVLYEIQVFMEDYARAAMSAIKFYIAPAPNYKTLFERERHLFNAKKHYETFLAKSKDPSDSWRKRKNILMKSRNELESMIKLISLQEQVSRFLKVCESQIKSGLFYEMEAMKNGNSACPPSLLGKSQEKNELICMLLINALHVDDGYDLIIKIINYDNLDGTSILSKVGKELVRLRQMKQIPHFLATVKCMFSNVVKVDDVILESVSAVNNQDGDVEEIIRMLISDSNKINAYLMCGKLKSAYLLAIKQNSALDVRRVMVAAEQCGQESIQRICKKWLDNNALKLKPKDPVSYQ